MRSFSATALKRFGRQESWTSNTRDAMTHQADRYAARTRRSREERQAPPGMPSQDTSREMLRNLRRNCIMAQMQDRHGTSVM